MYIWEGEIIPIYKPIVKSSVPGAYIVRWEEQADLEPEPRVPVVDPRWRSWLKHTWCRLRGVQP